MKNKLVEIFNEFAHKIGIDPLYLLTAIIVPLYFITNFSQIKKWKQLPSYYKSYHIIMIIALLTLLAFDVLHSKGLF
jgi:hypothetical protein